MRRVAWLWLVAGCLAPADPVDEVDFDGDGYAQATGDCDETDSTVNPGAVEVWYDGSDSDCAGDDDFDADADGYNAAVDCDDNEPTTWPGASETWYDGADSDCADDDDFDADGDGERSSDYEGEDCDDASADVNPGATEICDGIDNDCNGEVDEPTAEDAELWYADSDGDGFGNAEISEPACEAPSGFVEDDTDCDDTRGDINPDQVEVCDDLDADEDCNGVSEDDDSGATGKLPWYWDGDGDGYGNEEFAGVDYCNGPSGFVLDGTDCDDSDSTVNPGEVEVCDDSDTDEDCTGTGDDDDGAVVDRWTWYPDLDGDGFGDRDASGTPWCDPPPGYVLDNMDCDDGRDDVSPDEVEVCDDLDADEDCSGDSEDDDASATLKTTYYVDSDGDGYGDESAAGSEWCDPPSGMVEDATDCDDSRLDINPAGSEVCDADDADEDCDGSDDDDDSSVSGRTTYYADDDGDGFGDEEDDGTAWCDPPSGVVTDSTDCDDGDFAINRDATEVCNGTDDDCDGATDDDDGDLIDAATWYLDDDGDGYGVATDTVVLCNQPTGYAGDDRDCDDSDAAYNPGADEDDCTDPNDYNCDGSTGYTDADGDGSPACVDCDDSDRDVYPGAVETWYDGIDSDCEAGDFDADGDGYDSSAHGGSDCDDSDPSINPGAIEVCDDEDVDEDCNGAADEADPGVSDSTSWYADADGDDYGDASGPASNLCDTPSSGVSNNLDCDDGDAAVNPAAEEDCADGIDNDCTGTADDCDPVSESACTSVGAFAGSASNDLVGTTVERAGDQDGDGYDDLLVGAPGASGGAVYILWGPGTGSGPIDTEGHAITGATEAGRALENLGDLDSDGIDDFLVGAPGEAASTGAAYLLLGPGSALTDLADAEAEIVGESAADTAGWAVARADIDGDGAVELLVSAPGNDGGGTDAGAVYVLESSLEGGVDLASADYKLTGTSAGNHAGWAIESVGDSNGDGYEDFAVAAPWDDTTATDSGVVWIVNGPVDTSETLNRAASTRMLGESGSLAGYSLASGTDPDGDGTDDLLVGAYMATRSIAPQTGAAYLISLPRTGTVYLSAADAIIQGEAGEDSAGHYVAGLGDLNGDGFGDVAVAATATDLVSGTWSEEGAVALLQGPLSGTISTSEADVVIWGESAEDYIGVPALAGDMDGDGFQDLAIGASAHDEGTSMSTGIVYVRSRPLAASADQDCDGYDSLARGGEDCDDEDPDVSPRATEVCDDEDVDEDCNGVADDEDPGVNAATFTTWYPDGDGDGYGDESDPGDRSCDGGGSGEVTNHSDCDDWDADVSPGERDICDNFIDDDCDGSVDNCELIDLGTADVNLYYPGVGGYVGQQLVCPGDTNGDGWDDILTFGAYPGFALMLGPVLEDRSTSAADGSIYTSYPSTGDTIARLGDNDGDGTDDLLSASPYLDSGAGGVFVTHGPITGDVDLESDATAILGEDGGVNIGLYLDGGGDLFADGSPDIVFGSTYESSAGSSAGAVWIFNGPLAASTTLSAFDAKITGDEEGDYVGPVAGVGDADGDGFDDLLVGSFGESDGAIWGGAAYAFLGPVSGALDVTDAHHSYVSSTSNMMVGAAVEGAGDINDDGYADALVGTSQQFGSLYLLLGPLPASGDISVADATISASSPFTAYFGYKSAGGGDVNGDAYDDILVGAPCYGAGSVIGGCQGRAYLFYGPLTGTFTSSSADHYFVGDDTDEYTGYGLAFIGDQDGDTRDEVAIGEPRNDYFGSYGGWAYIIMSGGL